jgi:histidinol-phosphatase (PHP family)
MNKRLDYCYHTHTTRCGHAYGTDEAYVLSAIAQGYRVLGFSDHAFFPGLTQQGIRGDFSELDNYINSIRNLEKKYEKEIKIHLAFEIEYTPYYETYYQELLSKYHFDYLILGHHFEFQGNRILSYYGNTKDSQKIIQYGQEIAQALSKGYFSYVAHPDLYMMGYHPGWDSHAQQTAKTIIEAALRFNIPLELNLGGIRGRGMMTIGNETRYPYPYEPFWQMVASMGASVIVGVDAHAPQDFASGHEKLIFNLIEKYDLKVMDRLAFNRVMIK